MYSLLKCAADLPRQNKPGPQGHACCMRSQELNAVRNSSRSSSPSSGMSSFQRVLYSLLFGKVLGLLPNHLYTMYYYVKSFFNGTRVPLQPLGSTIIFYNAYTQNTPTYQTFLRNLHYAKWGPVYIQILLRNV